MCVAPPATGTSLKAVYRSVKGVTSTTSSVKYNGTKFRPIQQVSACESISQVEATPGSEALGKLAFIALTFALGATRVCPSQDRPPVVLVETEVGPESSPSSELSSSWSSSDMTLDRIDFTCLLVALLRLFFNLL